MTEDTVDEKIGVLVNKLAWDGEAVPVLALVRAQAFLAGAKYHERLVKAVLKGLSDLELASDACGLYGRGNYARAVFDAVRTKFLDEKNIIQARAPH